MRNHLLALAFLPCIATAQSDLSTMNRWSIGAEIGAHDGMAPSKGNTRLYQIQHFGLNGRYMLNNRFGLRLGVNYDFLDFMDQPYNTYYIRTSLEGVVNAGDIFHFQQVMPRIGLLFHGGFGISHMWSDNNPNVATTESLGTRSDEMLNFVFGATPQFMLNDRWSLNADLSFIFHGHQTNRFDMQARSQHGAIDGYMMNVSIGASYYFGKNKKHADWTPTTYGADNGDETAALEARIKTLEEQAKDDDKDGVPNSIDQEPATASGSLVDSKGVGLKDADGDGVADAYDACPEVAGTFGANGCLDSDKDGVADNEDACPHTPGLAIDKGCPQVKKEDEAVMNKALKGVQFNYQKAELLPSSLPVLDEVVKVMKNNPNYKLDIAGHTDNVGDPNENQILSEQRAQSVANYLVSKGVDASRLSVKGYGETQPKATNDTQEGQAINRRVEFNLLFD